MPAAMMERKPVTDIRKAFHFTDLQSYKPTRPNDPYEYMPGFGNKFQSEVIPGTVPAGQDHPQRPRFGLYMETFTYSAFNAPRQSNFGNFLYRAKPALATDGVLELKHKADLENCFLSSNKSVDILPTHAAWGPFPLPKDDETTDFVDGLHTLGGSGDPNLREGVAIYAFMINANMDRRAFCNTDGDLLIVPQLGDLDIQTELGRLFVQVGEICVVQRGIRFCVKLGPGHKEARGYVTEVWGSMWELPELGPLGAHGLANSRDFLHPVAHIDDDLHVAWTIVNKANGKYNGIKQDHSPFDIAAWHGNVVPYKYDLSKFMYQGSLSVDHTDPSIHTVLTARSRDPNTPIIDLLVFGPKWDVAENTFRPPSFHRNTASEFACTLYGEGSGPKTGFGGCHFNNLQTPHGSVQVDFAKVMQIHKSVPQKIFQNEMKFALETSRAVLWTEYARAKCQNRLSSGYDPKSLVQFTDNFSADPEAQKLFKQFKVDKEAHQKKMEVYYRQ